MKLWVWFCSSLIDSSYFFAKTHQPHGMHKFICTKIMNQLKAGAILNYIVIVLNTLVGLLYTPYMLRMMGQSEYGLYSLVASVIGYLSNGKLTRTRVEKIAIMDALKKDGVEKQEAIEKACGKYGRFDEAVKHIDPRHE